MQFTLRDLPVRERPRERLRSLGASSLSVQELLSIILSNGGKSGSVHAITNELLRRYQNLESLDCASIDELRQIKGVGQVKAIQIKAAVELGKRLHLEQQLESAGQILTSEDAFRLAEYYLKNKKKEHLLLFCLDVHGKLIGRPETVSVGLLDCSLVHPREIFNQAVRSSAAKIILVHNHPSGSAVPSPQDLEVTRQIYRAGIIMGIDLLDHIVLGAGEYTSIRQDHGELFAPN